MFVGMVFEYLMIKGDDNDMILSHNTIPSNLLSPKSEIITRVYVLRGTSIIIIVIIITIIIILITFGESRGQVDGHQEIVWF